MSTTTLSSIVATKLVVEREICVNDRNQAYGAPVIQLISMPLCSIWNTCVLETNMIGANRKETGANLFPLSIALNKKIVFRNLKSIFIIHYILFIIFSFLQNARATAAPWRSSPPVISIEVDWKDSTEALNDRRCSTLDRDPSNSPQHLHGMDIR